MANHPNKQSVQNMPATTPAASPTQTAPNQAPQANPAPATPNTPNPSTSQNPLMTPTRVVATPPQKPADDAEEAQKPAAQSTESSKQSDPAKQNQSR